jgi:hypothetical protein
MNTQFTTKTILLSVAVIAISLIGLMALSGGIYGHANPLEPLVTIGFLMPLWWPASFIGYAIGRKQLTGTMVIVFVLVELASVGIQFGTFLWGPHPG